jgi:hypothetical protein
VAGSMPPRVGRSGRRVVGLAAVVVIGAAVLAGTLLGGGLLGRLQGAPGGSPATASPSALAAGGTPGGSSIGASPTPGATPSPTLELVAAPLTGRLVTREDAIRRPIAVMIDDHVGARPQSGFNAASVVWQAPAEGGIPRYMLVFQDQLPTRVGPVRSSREYYIEWAAEWNAMYVHAGGSPQALETLALRGTGGWVWNAEAFRWEGRYLLRVHEVKVPNGPTYPLVAPHNLYTNGGLLEQLAARLRATDRPIAPVWRFGPDAPPEDRPVGARLGVVYPYEAISYRYDAVTNTYRRFISSGGPLKLQIDAADGLPVAPRNVVILKMAFGPLNDGHPDKHRLEASNVGHGVAWISTNGVTVKGTWRKASATAPTLLFGPDGQPVTLTVGQTFIEVMTLQDTVTIRAGKLAGSPLNPGGLAAP